MTSPRLAVITGANQGLGRAVAEGLAARLDAADRLLLTGRDPGRVAAAEAEVRRGAVARVEGRVLDVRDAGAVEALAAELGAVDLVVSNAGARLTPGTPPGEQVDVQVQTSNVATSSVLRAFGPRLRPGGRLLVVASSLGTLDHLGDAVRPRFAQAADGTLEDVDALVEAWRAAVHAGTAEAEGYPEWVNVPSKVAQVAAVRAFARPRRADDVAAQRLVCAVCPGLIDTAASRPWFADMSRAQSPQQAAVALLDLLLAPAVDPAFHGELVRFGAVVPWTGR